MNNQQKQKQWLGYLFPTLTALSSLLAVLAVLLDFETQTNYFRSGALLPTAATLIALLAAATGVLLSLSMKKEKIGGTPFQTTKSPAPAFYGFLVSALLLLASGINATTGLVALSLALSAAYISFTSNCHPKKDVGSTVFYGFATILAAIFFCALFYFDASIEINAPMKTASILSLLVCMIYFTGELRFLLNRPMKKLFLAMAYAAAAISIPASCAIFTSFIVGAVHTFTEMPELSLIALLKVQRIEYVSAAVMVLFTGLQAFSRASILLSTEKEEQEPSQDATAEQNEPSSPAPAKEQTKQPLPWEVDIDTLNRKE